MVTTSKKEEVPTCSGKRNLLFKIEKGKLKTKKVVKNLLKITIVDEQEPSVQSADSRQNHSSPILKLRK